MRIVLSWVTFTLGDWVSRPMNRWDRLNWLYTPYNRLMGWSVELQGESDKGPWNKVPDHVTEYGEGSGEG